MPFGGESVEDWKTGTGATPDDARASPMPFGGESVEDSLATTYEDAPF